MRFSTAGHVAVAVLLLGGVVNAVLILSPEGLDIASAYQQWLGLKVLLALAMTVLAIMNRYWWVPRIRRQPEIALGPLRRNTVLEVCVGVAILLIVSALGLSAPQ